MKSALGTIWVNRKKILEGVTNTIFKKQFVETVAAYRVSICEKCSEKGDECLVPGTAPCCAACGCSLKFKVRSLSSACGLIEKGKDPKWLPVLSQDDEDKHFSEIHQEDDTQDS